jgi:Uma2 family endonuclease
MSTILASSEQRVVLRSVSWETYLALTEESESGSGRMTYDQGVLEIMSPGMPHEVAKKLIGRMIETFTLCRGIEIRSSSSTTFKRSELQRGFEADESYYIQHASELRGIREIDLSIHPPPDLVIEVDMTNSSIPKKALFAAMKIPEVWRYDGVSLWMGGLYQDGYQDLQQSLVIPEFPRELASKLLDRQVEENETALMRIFLDSL